MSITISYTVKIQLGAYTIILQNWYYSSKTQNGQTKWTAISEPSKAPHN